MPCAAAGGWFSRAFLGLTRASCACGRMCAVWSCLSRAHAKHRVKMARCTRDTRAAHRKPRACTLRAQALPTRRCWDTCRAFFGLTNQPRGVLTWPRRYYHPAPPARAVVKAERSFEGISLDVPGQSARASTALSRFQLCPACYQNWCTPHRLRYAALDCSALPGSRTCHQAYSANPRVTCVHGVLYSLILEFLLRSPASACWGPQMHCLRMARSPSGHARIRYKHADLTSLAPRVCCLLTCMSHACLVHQGSLE
jgi:hypothetical protein